MAQVLRLRTDPLWVHEVKYLSSTKVTCRISKWPS